MWLFSGSIIELQPKLRYRRYNMPLFSIWIRYAEPHPEVWLRNCIGMMRVIKKDGIQTFNNQRVDIKFLSITGDYPALKLILNFIGHGGYFCCWYCYLRGVHVNNKRQYLHANPIILRGASAYKEGCLEAERTKNNVFGHLGTSILDEIMDTTFPEAIVTDYQHVTLLRHTKTITTSVYRRLNPQQRLTLDKNLKNQSFPHFFNRKMRLLVDLSYVKATEFRNILFYGLVPLLHHIMDIDFMAHLVLFVCSIRLYHSQPPLFDQQTSQIAAELFERYYEDHEQYHLNLQNFVLHLYVHYEKLYRNYGSSANIGCFAQEDLIGSVSSDRHGTRYHGELITYYYNLDFTLNNRESERAPQQQQVYEPIDMDKNFVLNQCPALFEQHVQLCNCSYILNCVFVYRRCIVRNRVYHSLLYNKRGNAVSYFLKQKFSDLFRASVYFDWLKAPLDSCFVVLRREPCTNFDCVDVNFIFKHYIVFDTNRSLIITEVSAYNEHGLKRFLNFFVYLSKEHMQESEKN
ncbi:unnamed protein product [Didymodactylos carnosus]|uniref:Uncharacterized protein n=1 Tax=Didymodactylos carnosus TaxID=1234261 RepID=A0A815WNF5_9BILA|nr:unnamed protein product [Didymodactylos carnosus]CAF4406481.1 unnamed protein product [Didymodactylos carnosus]